MDVREKETERAREEMGGEGAEFRRGRLWGCRVRSWLLSLWDSPELSSCFLNVFVFVFSLEEVEIQRGEVICSRKQQLKPGYLNSWSYFLLSLIMGALGFTILGEPKQFLKRSSAVQNKTRAKTLGRNISKTHTLSGQGPAFT